METLTQLFIDRWSKPMSKYCASKNLKRTGHYWEHGWQSVADGGDNMAMYAWHQMPAIDMLFNQYNDDHPQAQFGNARAVKELSSVANQMGRIRTLSETYGGGGWNESFEDFKRLGDWEYALGVNFMNQHLAHMTIMGARKYDYPPVFTPLSSWWEDYWTQNDYFSRLSLVLSGGEQLNDVLVLEPTTSSWLYFSYVNSNPRMMDIGFEFQRFVTALEKNQAEYDLGSENIIKDHGAIRKGRFAVGERAYRKVVISPGTENLNAATYRLLRAFVNSGGEVAVFSVPHLIDGKENDEAKEFFSGVKGIKQFAELSPESITEIFGNDKIQFRIDRGNDLYHHRRTYNDGELIFLANSSLTDSVSGHITVSGKSFYELDAMSGQKFGYQAMRNGKYMEADFAIPPAGSLLLFAGTSEDRQYAVKERLADGRKLEALSPMKVKRLKPNILTLDFCDLTIDGKTERNLYTVEACTRLYGHYGMSDPWNSAIQYRQTIVERDTFSSGNIAADYRFILLGDTDWESMKLIAEQPDVWKVKINGKPVESEGASFLDSRFGTYPIGSYVKEGVNTVELSVSPMSIYAEIAPVYVIGNFALEEDDTADKLYFVVGHVPLDFVAAGHPAVFPYGVLAVDADELAALACELAVELGSLDGDCIVFGEAAGCFTHHGKYHRKMVPELLVEDFEDFLFVLVYLVPEGLTLVEGQCFDLFAEFFDSLGVVRYRLRNLCANGVDFGAQPVERQSFHAGYFGFDSLQHRLYGFHVAKRLVAKYLFKNGSK